VDNVTNIILMN